MLKKLTDDPEAPDAPRLMRKLPKKNSDNFIKGLPPADKGTRYGISDFGDRMVAGLKIRVTDKGSKSFILWRRYNGAKSPAARSLGSVGEITLAQARAKASEWIELIAKGEDPRAAERRRREESQDRNAITFGKVFEDYITKHVKGQRRAKDAEREMRKDLLPRWKDKPLHEISRRDVIRMVQAVKERGPYQAHNLLGHAKTFFSWAIENDYGIETSPCTFIKRGRLIGKKVQRQRVLDDPEIKEFWRGAGRLGYPFGTLFQMLLLTGQRRSEIAEAMWREFDLKKRILTIPEERFKSGSDHIVPLTDEVMALLDTIPKWNAGDHLFSTTNGVIPINGFSFQKSKLDAFMRGALGAAKLKNWTLHDLRRTVRTRLASLKVRDEVAEMIIGHGRKGLQRTYDQHQYIEEMREGLELWAKKLREIVS